MPKAVAQMSPGLSRAGLAVLAGLLALTLLLGFFLARPALQGVERTLYDARLRLAPTPPVYPRLVHVDIDDTSLDVAGPWPWNRAIHAKGLDMLRRCGADLVAYDIVFHAERDEAGDAALERAIAEHGRVVLAAGFGLTREDQVVRLALGPEDEPLLASLLDEPGPDAPPATSYPQVERSFLPAPGFAAKALGVGHISANPDPDGVFRRLPLVLGFDGRFLPSIDLLVASHALCERHARLEPGRIRLEPAAGETCEPTAAPVDGQGAMFINYAATYGRGFVHLPFRQLLEAWDNPDLEAQLRARLAGSLALVSLTASGNTDMGPTPLSRAQPLPMVHSNAINTLLMGRFLRVAPAWAEFAAVLALLAALFAAWKQLRPLGLLVACVAALALWGGVDLLLFIQAGLALNTAWPLLTLALGGSVLLSACLLQTSAQAARQRRLLETYFSPQVREQLMREPDRLFATASEDLSVMFTDIVGFSSMADAMHPEAIQKLLLEYFDAMTEVVFATQGAVDKFIGDGMMAFWGFPPEGEAVENARRSALDAARAGLLMQERLGGLNRKWAAEGRPNIHIRVGVHTDYMTVGNMGSRRRMEFTLLGRAVNLAQRLESKCPPDGVLVSARTRDLLGDKVQARDMGDIQVKGFEKPVRAYLIESLTDS